MTAPTSSNTPKSTPSKSPTAGSAQLEGSLQVKGPLRDEERRLQGERNNQKEQLKTYLDYYQIRTTGLSPRIKSNLKKLVEKCDKLEEDDKLQVYEDFRTNLVESYKKDAILREVAEILGIKEEKTPSADDAVEQAPQEKSTTGASPESEKNPAPDESTSGAEELTAEKTTTEKPKISPEAQNLGTILEKFYTTPNADNLLEFRKFIKDRSNSIEKMVKLLANGDDNIQLSKETLTKIEKLLKEEDPEGKLNVLNEYARKVLSTDNETFRTLVDPKTIEGEEKTFSKYATKLIEELRASLNKNLPQTESITIDKDIANNIGNLSEYLNRSISNLDAKGNNIIVIEINSDEVGDKLTLSELNIKNGARVVIRNTGESKLKINLTDATLQGRIEGDDKTTIALDGEIIKNQRSKKSASTTTVDGEIKNAESALNTDATNTTFIGGLADKIYNSEWYKNRFRSKRDTVMKICEGMIYNGSTKFYPSLEQTIKKIGLEGLDKETIKVISTLLKSTNQKGASIQGYLNSLNATEKAALVENITAQLGIKDKTKVESILNSVQNNTDNTLENFKNFEIKANKFKEEFNQKVHDILAKYSKKVDVDPSMTFDQLKDFLRNENTYAEITEEKQASTDDEKEFLKKFGLKQSIEVYDFSTEREFKIYERDDGKLVGFLKKAGNVPGDKEVQGREARMFIFDSPSEFLTKFIIEDQPMSIVNDKKAGSEEEEVKEEGKVKEEEEGNASQIV